MSQPGLPWEADAERPDPTFVAAGDAPTDPRYWLAFSFVSGIGPVRLRRLLDYFGDLALAWRATSFDLAAAGLDQRSIDSLVESRQRIDLDAELDRAELIGATIIAAADARYPMRLREIYGSPTVLYVLGDLKPVDDLAVAVVGTRRATAYGQQVTERITRDLVAAGVTIVSGLARGIDTHAHRAALDSGGRTIAVLGCGVDVTYPPENAKLAERIATQGAVISEYPLGTSPAAQNFPARNRVISGLARGTVVVEAGETSGALITARFAVDQDREVFAVPGSILSRASDGPNRLIQQGAKLVLSASDILAELNLASAGEQIEIRQLLPTDPIEKAVIAALSAEPRHVDDLTRATDLPPATVSATLTILELKGFVRHVGGMCYVLLR